MEKPKQVAFTLRIPEELKIQLDMITMQQDRSTNSLITVILKDYIETRRKKIRVRLLHRTLKHYF